MKKKFILPLATAAFLCFSGSVYASMPPIAPQVGQTVAMLNKQFVQDYVRNREGYSWETIQQTFDSTMAMSDKKVAKEFFNHFISSDKAPHKLLRNKYEIVISVKAVDFDGEFAKVHFTKQIVSKQDKAETVSENFVATVAWKYHGKLSDEERQLNPFGFKVTHYQVEKEQG